VSRPARQALHAELIGEIVLLQVQHTRVKFRVPGVRGEQYNPTGYGAVPALLLERAGVTGLASDGVETLDLHHSDHPFSRDRGGKNSISLAFTSHYAAMRDRFGPHMADGMAGENILVRTARIYDPHELAGGLLIARRDGTTLDLGGVIVAEPCAPFARYATEPDGDRAQDQRSTDALVFLRGGMRGYYAGYRGEPARIGTGDRLYRRR